MKVIQIDKKDLTDGIENARQAYRLIGACPMQEGPYREFRELAAGEQADLDSVDTVLSAKAIAFPQSEVMFEYNLDENSEQANLLQAPAKDYSPRAVVGIRPYDAAALAMLRKNFETAEYRDPYWCNAYEACTFVGLAVNEPSSTDFSLSTGSGPFDEKGLDVLLVDAGKHYLAKVLSDKGVAFMKTAGWQNETDTETALIQIEELKKAAEAKISSRVFYDKIKEQSILDLYEAPFWEDVAFACINCGTCTFVCPTCWCFDIQDENYGKQGTRMKLWDSCMFPLFSLHASGHNPRATKTMRVRQRFMHKLKYFLDKYEDGIMCVGCGRCVRLCPVNIDIRKVCNMMNSHDAQACAV
jgi:ferredoxin